MSMDENPLRTFMVRLTTPLDKRTPMVEVDESTDPPSRRAAPDMLVKQRVLKIEAHVPVVTEGTLYLMRYSGNQAWARRIVASGEWRDVECSVPTPEEVAQMEAIAQRENDRQRQIEQAGHAKTNTRLN